MKIVFVGGGTAGHFNPLMAVAEKLRALTTENKMIMPSLYYFGEKNFNPKMLEERSIDHVYIPSGKNRMYFSVQNFFDIFKVFFGTLLAFFKLLVMYPDVVFSKGGYDSIPTCLAAFILRIPIVMHDSDAVPGRASLLISRFAYRVGVSYPESIAYYSDKENIAVTGQPMLEKYTPAKDFKKEYNTERKNILILGGSSGSVKLNDAILEILPELCSKYNIIHQTGEANIKDIESRVSVILESYSKKSYAPYASLDLSKIYSHIDLAVSRAGSAIFELKSWQIPSIIVPIPKAISRDQLINAETAQKNSSLFKIIEEENLSPHLLLNEINGILEDRKQYEDMLSQNKDKVPLDASDTLAREILAIAKTHK